MMYLPFKCRECNNEFETIDEMYVNCPIRQTNKVTVQWDKYKFVPNGSMHTEKVKQASEVIIKPSIVDKENTKI